MSDPQRAKERTRTFLALLGAFVLLAGFLVRCRIQLGSALPTSSPLRWHLTGLAQDFLLYVSVAAICLLLPARIGRVLASLYAVAITILHVMESEAVILFGSVLRPQDFNAGPVGTTILRSIRDYAALLLAVAVIGSFLAVIAALRLSKTRTIYPRWRLLVSLVAAAAIFIALPLNVHRIETARNPVVTVAKLVQDSRIVDEHKRRPIGDRKWDPALIRLLHPNDGRKILSAEYPLAHQAPPSPFRVQGRPNILFIGLESVRAEEVGVYGGKVPGVTPNFDRLAAKSIRFENAYAAGAYTPGAEMALLYGLLSVHDRIIITSAPHVRFTGLPEVLGENGWRSRFWMSSTDAPFFRRDRFYKPRGFQMFDGHSFPPEDPRVNWGVSDRALAKRAAHAMGKLQQPFLALMLTVDNHHPFQVPSDGGPPVPIPDEFQSAGKGQFLGHHTLAMLQTIHYTDQALGDFMAAAEKQPWFHNTIFVIGGDHGIAIPPVGPPLRTLHRLSELRYRVPLIMYSPLFGKEMAGKVIEGPISQIDIPTTILSMLGIDTRAGFGINIFAGNADPNRALFSWSDHEDMLAIHDARFWYYCAIPVTGIPENGIPQHETLIDTSNDPNGERNVADQHPAQMARFRKLAQAYMDYRILALTGKSGLPPG